LKVEIDVPKYSTETGFTCIWNDDWQITSSMLLEKDITVKGRRIKYKGRLLLTAPAEIEKYIIIEDLIVVLVNGSSILSDQNVFGYSVTGELHWTIPEPDALHQRNSYTSIYLSAAGELRAYSESGVEYTLNQYDGSVISKLLIK
jgi:hypothetical protein